MRCEACGLGIMGCAHDPRGEIPTNPDYSRPADGGTGVIWVCGERGL